MRIVRSMIVVALALVVSQCARAPVASLEPPGHDAWWSVPEAGTGTHRRVVRSAAVRSTAVRAAVARDPVTTGSSDSSLKPLSPEWYAAEQVIDNRLNRKMNICSRC